MRTPAVAFDAVVLSLSLGTGLFRYFHVSKQTHMCRSGWGGVVEVMLMQMRWCTAILVFIWHEIMFLCFIPIQYFFCGFSLCKQENKKIKTFPVSFCFAFHFDVGYIFNLVHISLYIKMQFLMQSRQSLVLA